MSAQAQIEMEQQPCAIRVRNLGKAYKVYHRNADLLKEVITGRARHEEHWALRDISFEVPRGSVVGVVGPNGSGKSTLLRIAAGLLDASTGSVETHGRISAILELGTGFHPDFTGRQNIVTGGLCSGMTQKEVEDSLPWIIDFSELGDVIDQPFRTYSSGMQARLTFATAIAVNPEVFIVDEALAAGDAYFVAKCMRRIREICASGATVLFVSHGTGQVAQLCDLALWIEGGRLREFGPAREVARHYDYSVHARLSDNEGQIVEFEVERDDVGQQRAEGFPVAISGLKDGSHRQRVEVFRKGPVYIEKVSFRGMEGVPTSVFRTWDPWVLEVEYSCSDEINGVSGGMAMTIEREDDLLRVAQFNTNNPAGHPNDRERMQSFQSNAKVHGMISCTMPQLQLLEGRYVVSLALMPNVTGLNEYYEYHQRTHRFQVIPAAYPSGAVFYPIVEWKHGAMAYAGQARG